MGVLRIGLVERKREKERKWEENGTKGLFSLSI